MTLYVRSVQYLQIYLSHIDAFNLACGSKINLDKYLTLPIGCTFSDSDVRGIKTIDKDHREKYLGIYLQRSRKSSSLIEPKQLLSEPTSLEESAPFSPRQSNCSSLVCFT